MSNNHSKQHSFVESLFPIVTGVAIGMGFRTVLGHGDEKRTLFRVTQVSLGVTIAAGLVIMEEIARHIKASHQGHEIT